MALKGRSKFLIKVSKALDFLNIFSSTRRSNSPLIASLFTVLSLSQALPALFSSNPLSVSRLRSRGRWLVLALSHLVLGVHIFASCYWLYDNVLNPADGRPVTSTYKTVLVVYVGYLFAAAQGAQIRLHTLLNDGLILANSLVKIEQALVKSGLLDFLVKMAHWVCENIFKPSHFSRH